MASKKDEQTITIKPVEMTTVTCKIVGDTPLLVHNWSLKAKREILEAEQTDKTKNKKGSGKEKQRPLKIPMQDMIGSLYWLTCSPNLDFEPVYKEEDVPKAEAEAKQIYADAIAAGARFGFPATAIKKCAASTAYRTGQSKDKVSILTSFFVEPSSADPDGLLAEVVYKQPPVMHESMVKVGMGSSDIRYRALFRDWEIPLTFQFNKNGQYKIEDFLNMISAGGQLNGLGEWRNEKGGTFGQFHIEAL